MCEISKSGFIFAGDCRVTLHTFRYRIKYHLNFFFVQFNANLQETWPSACEAQEARVHQATRRPAPAASCTADRSRPHLQKRKTGQYAEIFYYNFYYLFMADDYNKACE